MYIYVCISINIFGHTLTIIVHVYDIWVPQINMTILKCGFYLYLHVAVYFLILWQPLPFSSDRPSYQTEIKRRRLKKKDASAESSQPRTFVVMNFEMEDLLQMVGTVNNSDCSHPSIRPHLNGRLQTRRWRSTGGGGMRMTVTGSETKQECRTVFYN